MTTTDIEQGLEQRGIDVIRGLADGRGAEGELRPPGHADGAGPARPRALDPDHEVRRRRPDWPDRDRFVLSNGHASMLLYSLLYLTGFGLTLDDLREFRQWGSKTAGHPEYRHAAGIEVTTGPLGQGFANGVGIGLAEANLRARFGEEVVDHHTFVFCGDGDLEEGVSHEAASLAGHLGLGRLVYVYDDNHITIDGPTELSYSDDVPEALRGLRLARACELGEVANDLDALEAGLRAGMAEAGRPSMLVLRSHIGYPSPKYTDTAKAHGSPLGADEVAAVKEILGLPPEDFSVPDDVLEHYRAAGVRGRAAREEWERRSAAFHHSEPDLAGQLDACHEQRGLVGWESKLPAWDAGGDGARHPPGVQPRSSTPSSTSCPGWCAAAPTSPRTPAWSSRTRRRSTSTEFGGRQLHYGIREHGMGSVMNGMAVSFLMPAGGTFFVFSDYMRGAVRLAALSRYKSLFVWTHDSVGLGEDGPTHQPVEQLASHAGDAGAASHPSGRRQRERARRGGSTSTARARPRWSSPGRSSRCSAGTAERAPEGVPRGAYTLVDETGDGLDLVLIATGSEVSVCVAALEHSRRRCRCGWCRCRRGTSSPRNPTTTASRCCRPTCRRSPVEAAATFGWERYADDAVGIDHFGASAPGPWSWRSSGSPPRTSPRVPARCSRTENEHDQSAIARLNDFGQSPWYDNLARPLLTGGGLAAAGRRRRHPRGHVEPDDPRQGHRCRRGLRRAARRLRPAAACRSRTRTGRSCSTTSSRPPTSCARCTTRTGGGDGFVSVEVAPDARARHRRHHRGGAVAASRASTGRT